MAKFIVSMNTELRIEAETAEEALLTAFGLRKFVIECLRGRLEELHLEKVSMGRISEVMEVNAAWLENQRLRTKYRVEWEYTSRQVPLTEAPDLFFTHRIATHPANIANIPLEGDEGNEPR